MKDTKSFVRYIFALLAYVVFCWFIGVDVASKGFAIGMIAGSFAAYWLWK